MKSKSIANIGILLFIGLLGVSFALFGNKLLSTIIPDKVLKETQLCCFNCGQCGTVADAYDIFYCPIPIDGDYCKFVNQGDGFNFDCSAETGQSCSIRISKEKNNCIVLQEMVKIKKCDDNTWKYVCEVTTTTTMPSGTTTTLCTVRDGCGVTTTTIPQPPAPIFSNAWFDQVIQFFRRLFGLG